MKFNKSTYLAGMLSGGLVVSASVVGCWDSPELFDFPLAEAEGGAGGVGGTTTGDGGSGGDTDCNDLPIPSYICNLEKGTDPEFLKVINDCIIPNHVAAQKENPRAGNAMVSTASCGGCVYKLDTIKQEGAIALAMPPPKSEGLSFHPVYIDPFFNDESMNRATAVGVDCVPAENKIVEDPFPTTENPGGISTLLKRQKVGFKSLREIADFYGCDSSKIPTEQMMSKEKATEKYGSLVGRIDLIGKMCVGYDK